MEAGQRVVVTVAQAVEAAQSVMRAGREVRLDSGEPCSTLGCFCGGQPVVVEAGA